MKLLFLGTGAADWDIQARREGEFFRRDSSALIDGSLLIDPGPHIFDFAEKTGNPHLFDRVTHILVTHTHDDHFNEEAVLRLCREHNCEVWGDPACLRRLAAYRKNADREIRFFGMPLFSAVSVGDYLVTSVPSNHETDYPEEVTRNYIIRKPSEQKTMFYGLDTGWFQTKSWGEINRHRYDTMVMELTVGEAEFDFRNFSHTSIAMLRLMLGTMRAPGNCAENAIIVVSHMARTLHGSHEQLIEQLRPLSVTPAKDGDQIEI